MSFPRARSTAPAAIVVIALAAAPARAMDDLPMARLDALKAAQKAAFERYSQELQKVARTEEAQRPALDRFLEELNRNVGSALELARACPDDPAAFEALKFVIVTNKAGPGDASATALRMVLERDDARSPRQDEKYLVTLSLVLFQYPDAERALRHILDDNPDRNVRRAACFWLAEHRFQQAWIVRRFRADPATMKNHERYTAAVAPASMARDLDPAALDREGEALLERVVAEFPGTRMEDDERDLAAVAAGKLFARRHLTIGKVAPEIEGADHEGKVFKLGDYRGKVVVLTFSANWCGPCVGMYPQERELVARLKGKPFAMVSVNADPDIETLKESVAVGKITWRCWWDGAGGPIATRWGVLGFPGIFVLDKTGAIRFREVRGDALDKAVDSLLDEMKSGAPPR